MTQKPPTDDPANLRAALVRLNENVQRLNSQPFFQREGKPMRLLGFQVLRGVAFGLGSVLGATLVVSLVVYFLAQIDFIPVIGDWAAQIAARIQR